MPKPLESGTTTGCPSIQVGFHSFTQRIRVRKHLQDFLRHRRRTQGRGMDAPGWSRSASLCSLLWRNHPLSSQSHPSQPGPFSHWLGSYVRMCWRADTEHRHLSGVLTHHQSPWQSGCSVGVCLLPFQPPPSASMLPTGMAVGYSEQDGHPFPAQRR